MVSDRLTPEVFPEMESIPHYMLKTLVPLQDLKRQQPAHYKQSIASSLFVESWERFFYGEELSKIALKITAKALIAVLLPGCDGQFFAQAKISKESTQSILSEILEKEYKAKLNPGLYQSMLEIVPKITADYYGESDFERNKAGFQLRNKYDFVDILCRQPRAGATKPGVDRLLLLPPERHSDHCLIVAVYAVLLSGSFGAAPGLPFLTGLAHHLHNTVLPDCGFAGEIALGDHLESIIKNGREAALKNVEPGPAKKIWQAIDNHENLTNPEGRASSAADVLDRVLDIKWRVRAASVTESDLLEELELVHDGPIKNFQTHILNAVGL